MNLRDYQSRGSDAVFDQWRQFNSTLIVCPTGCGKTIMFADIIRRCFPRRSMVIAHREELIWQARNKINQMTGLKCEIEMGEYKAHGDWVKTFWSRPTVVISTVQTQCAGNDGGGRMSKFDPMEFGLLIIDEAHHATADSYRRLISYYRGNPNLKVLGVTATPDRADEEALGQVFESVAFDYEILDAIHDGWLVPIDQQLVKIEGLDFSRCRTTAGDLNGADLAAVMEAEKNLHGIASASIEIIGQRRAIVFTSGVKHAEMLAQIFNRHRIGMASWISGTTNKDLRRDTLSRFAQGEVQVICNCGVLTEGFDDPGVEVIIMGRPTKSRALYSQMIGRSTRPVAGLVDQFETPADRKDAIAASAKKSCLVVDFVGNSGRHKLMTSLDILDGKVSEQATYRALQRIKNSNGPISVSRALDEAEQEIRKERQAAMERERLADEQRKRTLIATATWHARKVDPFDVLEVERPREQAWDRGRTLSEKQRNLLARQGIDPETITYGQGRLLISEMFKRWDSGQHGRIMPTEKQVKVLLKFGYSPSVSFQRASEIITAIAENGWRRPAEDP